MLRIAAFTMVRNERVFLPLWLRHYGAQVGHENLYVLDHLSDDGSTTNLPCCVIPLTQAEFCDAWKVDIVSHTQHELLKRYDVVVYSDCDEFLIPDPAGFAGLRDYCACRPTDVVRCRGYDVVHRRGVEPPLDPWRPVLNQRNRWIPRTALDKPLLARIPVNWHAGHHAIVGEAVHDPSLLLVHLHWADFDLALAKLRFTRAMAWSARSLAEKWGAHWRMPDAALEELFARFDDDPASEPIPERFKTQL